MLQPEQQAWVNVKTQEKNVISSLLYTRLKQNQQLFVLQTTSELERALTVLMPWLAVF